MKIEFYRHNLESQDIERVTQVLNSLFLTTGAFTREFEEKFAQYARVKHVVAVTSCTAALQLSLLAFDIGPGDEVITTPMTFLATATAILHAGATPVFVDVEPHTGLIDPLKIEKAITPKTRAILPVHLYGPMADMRAISKIAKRHNLKIIEDCAHCIEGERDGVRPGYLGDTACYSFYATKNMASGEGGAIATNDDALADKLRKLRLHGMSTDAASRYSSKYYKHWDMDIVGWKYNMDNIHAALLIGQIERLNSYWQRRDALAKKYESAFRDVPGIRFPEAPGKSARHLQTVWVDSDRRDEIVKMLNDRDIGVAVNYRAVHTLKYFKETYGFRPSDFPHAFEIGSCTLSLPLYPKLTDEEIQYVIDSLTEIVSRDRVPQASTS